jgi:hypothetical protein
MIDKPTYEKLLNQNIQWDKWYEQYICYESMCLEYLS